jgi:hypothetical protein
MAPLIFHSSLQVLSIDEPSYPRFASRCQMVNSKQSAGPKAMQRRRRPGAKKEGAQLEITIEYTVSLHN